MSTDREIGELTARVAALEVDMHEFGQDVKQILATMNQAKGGWRLMMAVAGLSGAVGAALVKLLPWLAVAPK